MEETGEASIRVARILEASKSSYGSIYHHFGSREGLVQAALVERYVTTLSAGLEILAEEIEQATTEDDVVALLVREVHRYGTTELAENRRRRINALGAAMYRPEVLAEIAVHQSAHYDNVADALAVLQDRGLISADVNLRAFSSWFLGLVLSRFFAELDTPRDLEAWSTQTVEAAAAVLRLTPRSVL
jgi:AcrR family transcriptional regulator